MKSPRKPKPQRRVFEVNSSASPYTAFSINRELLKKFGRTNTQLDHDTLCKRHKLANEAWKAEQAAAGANAKQAQKLRESFQNSSKFAPKTELDPEADAQDPEEMQTRGAWDTNLFNPANRVSSPLSETAPKSVSRSSPDVRDRRANNQATPLHGGAGGRVQKASTPTASRRSSGKKRKSVAFREDVDVATVDKGLSDEEEEVHDSGPDKENQQGDLDSSSPESVTQANTMADAERPKLKLKMSSLGGVGAQPAMQPLATPVPQSAGQRLKLSFSRKSSMNLAETKIKKEDSSPEPGLVGRKRKRTFVATVDDEDDDLPLAQRKPSIGPRKITLKTKIPPTTPAPQSAITPHVKFNVKGKIPSRKVGVGYDSENEETERDPVILEGFILRMPPGPDCDLVNQAIANGTIALSKLHGGIGVGIRMLDTYGRRAVLNVKERKYAATLVDLPCIIEALKSWDKKAFIKSIDICQMLLVLGPCKSDEEARNYPLPPDIDPQSHQYAHGITPPMKWVRKRRFARVKRTRVDDIESVERKVAALLAEDAKAVDVDVELLDHDPREDEEEYSATESASGDDEDAEGEEEEEDYFTSHAEHGGPVETPQYAETPQEMDDDDDADLDDEFSRALEGGSEKQPHVNGHHHHPPPEDSSFAVTSTSASPSASANITSAATPASAAGGNTSDDDEVDDEDDDDDAGSDDDKSESGKEDDENLQQAKERIKELEEKIREQKEVLVKTQNQILRRKIATKIGELEKDVGMMRRGIGVGVGGDGEGEDGE